MKSKIPSSNIFQPLIYRHGFDYTCSCPDGYGGAKCQLQGCGGTLTSQETPQEITIPQVTDHMTGCIWNINSPAESRINLTTKDYHNQYLYCSIISLAVFSGLLNSKKNSKISHIWAMFRNAHIQ